DVVLAAPIRAWSVLPSHPSPILGVWEKRTNSNLPVIAWANCPCGPRWSLFFGLWRRHHRRDQPMPEAEMKQLDVRRRAELRLDGVVIVRRRLAADIERGSDLVGGLGIENHTQYLEFARRQSFDALALVLNPIDRQLLADLGTDGDLAIRDAAHRVDKQVRRTALGDIALGAGAKGLQCIRRPAMHGEDENAGLGVEFPDMLDRIDTATARHRDIHDDDIGPQILVALIAQCRIRRLADDADAVVLLQQRAIALAYDGMVIDKKHANRFGRHCAASASAPTGMTA